MLDRLLVGEGQADDDVGGRAVGADEAPVARLRVADDLRNEGIARQLVERVGDRRLELRRGRVGALGAADENDERPAPGAEVLGEVIGDRGRFARRIEPAALRELAAELLAGDRDAERADDREDEDRARKR